MLQRGARDAHPWNITERPGGWVLLERPDQKGGQVRRRLAILEHGGKITIHDPLTGTYFGEISKLSAGTGASAQAGDGDFTAQFPGKVRKVLVADGAKVAAGDKLLLLEAMKMEFAIQAHAAGTVKKVRVQEGQQLQPGDNLIDFEEAKGK